MRQGKTRLLAALVAALVALVALAGCAGGQNIAANEEQKANRAYMSQVNQLMDELGESLESFTDAVSRNDVVNMRAQADDAYRTLDKLADSKAPDGLSDVKDKYVDGSKKLREALNGYIALYTEVASASDPASYDWQSYESRRAEVQTLYDDGVKLMKEGDEAAAAKS